MPRQTNRRELLADAIIRVLARSGAHGLTHRAVDSAAHVPTGTTSRYFRTRAALLLAAAQAVRDRHRAYMERLSASEPGRQGDLIGALAELIADSTQANRDLYIARIELSLASLRNPELRPILEEIRTASIATARELARAAGIELTESQTDVLGSLLLGLTLERVTLERPRLTANDLAMVLARAVAPSSVR
jgi:DNA-binding transcriptional regulator YbjK